MKKLLLIILLSYLILGIGCIFTITEFINYSNIYSNNYKNTQTAETSLYFMELKEKTGLEFNDWAEIREYIYCHLLKRGMTQNEVNNSLSIFGDLKYKGGWEIYFENDMTNYNLSPIVLFFSDYSTDATLIGWSESTISHHPIPCYIDGRIMTPEE